MIKFIDKRILKIAIWTSIIVFIILILLPFHPAYFDYENFSFKNLNPFIASQLGNLVGGYFGTFLLILSGLLLYKTLIEQRHSFEIQNFEQKFFDLLKIHRENVDEMTLQNIQKRKVFNILRLEYQEVYEVVKTHYKLKDCNQIDKANITYIIFFFGVFDTGENMCKDLLSKYDTDIVNSIIGELKKTKIKQCKFINDFKTLENYKPFNGHQSRLGHYFRNMYQTVKFTELKEELKPEQKEYYIKTLRAQLSNQELSIFFYNSLSDLGKPWRVREYDNKSLIEKYQFLKNIPLGGFTFELNPENFYKQDYEWDEIKNCH